MASRHQKLALAVSALIALGITGCATTSPGTVRRDPTAAPLSGVIATGTLVGAQASDPISGTVAVVANPATHALTIIFTGLAGNLGDVGEAELSATLVRPGMSCTPSGLAFSAGSLSTTANQSLAVHSDRSPGWQNPSFLRSLILTSRTAPTANGCASGMVASAPLAWTIGDPRPDIHVVDGGPRAGAMGHTTEDGGKPTSYTVAAGDNLNSIAARFHLTLNDLFYLNPARTPSPLSTVTDIGELLNLSKSNR